MEGGASSSSAAPSAPATACLRGGRQTSSATRGGRQTSVKLVHTESDIDRDQKEFDTMRRRYDKEIEWFGHGHAAAVATRARRRGRRSPACPTPAMPCRPVKEDRHRRKIQTELGFSACVCRPVSKKEIESNPAAKKAVEAEWARLWEKGVWDVTTVCEWSDLNRISRGAGKTIHVGRRFCICVDKNTDIPDKRKFKYRVVFQGDEVRD